MYVRQNQPHRSRYTQCVGSSWLLRSGCTHKWTVLGWQSCGCPSRVKGLLAISMHRGYELTVLGSPSPSSLCASNSRCLTCFIRLHCGLAGLPELQTTAGRRSPTVPACGTSTAFPSPRGWRTLEPDPEDRRDSGERDMSRLLCLANTVHV